MYRSSSADSFQDAHFQQVVWMIYRDLFEADSSPAALDFFTIEQRAHKADQEVARRLCEQFASERARTADQPQRCPDCGRLCSGSIETRELLTRDGPVKFDEAQHYCSHCRRAFFPQSTKPTFESSSLQPSGPDHRGVGLNGNPLVRGSR